jgi:hypothetical protein
MKKSLFLALVVGLCITANLMAQVPNYVPTNGLVGWWPFNGNANDESGNGNNGTVNGATLTADRFGNVNSAYSFNNSRIETFNDINTPQLSISLWVKLASSSLNSGCLVSNTNWDTAAGEEFGFAINVNTPNFSFPIKEDAQCIPGQGWLANQDFNINSISQANSIGFWHFCVITTDGYLNNLYLDGELIESRIRIGNIQQCSGGSLRFGSWWQGEPGWLEGDLDDIGIWNRALTECEIQDLYNAQLGSFSNSTVSVNPTSSALGSNATLTVSSPLTSLQWQSNPSNVGWVNLSNNTQYNGATNDTLVVSNLQLSNHNQPFRVLACGDTSNIATIQIADTCITNVTVYDTLLTTVTDTLIINTTLSLPAPNNENTILIYPNPASDHITIDNGNFSGMAGYSIKIENNAGQQVFQSAINQAQFYVDLSTWTGNGLYFVHLIDPQNNTVTVRKIVLQ